MKPLKKFFLSNRISNSGFTNVIFLCSPSCIVSYSLAQRVWICILANLLIVPLCQMVRDSILEQEE
jgi:hypothetical protein